PCDTPSCPPPGPALPSPHLRAGTTVSRTPATPPHDGRVRHEPGDPAARAGCRSRTQVGAGGALGPRRPPGVPRTTPLPPHPLATARRPQGPRLHGRRHPRRALRLGDPAGERGRGLHVPTPGGTAQRRPGTEPPPVRHRGLCDRVVRPSRTPRPGPGGRAGQSTAERRGRGVMTAAQTLAAGAGFPVFVIFVTFVCCALFLAILVTTHRVTPGDFYIGDGRLTPLQNGIAIFGVYLSAATLFGSPGRIALT